MWVGHVARMEEMKNAYKILAGNIEISRHKWEDNIRVDRQEIGREVVDYIHLAQDRDQWLALVNAVMNVWVQ